MTRPFAYTSLVFMAALVAGCSANAGGSSSAGPNQGGASAQEDPNSDSDNDGVIAAHDKCPGTADTGWTDTQGCSENDDADQDGVPTDQDLCPDTPAGEQVDGNGCSASQNAATSAAAGGAGGAGSSSGTDPKSGDVGNWQSSDDGSVSQNGFATFVLDPKGAFPVVLKTLEKNVKKLSDGFEVSGTLMVDVPGGEHVTLAEAKVSLKYDSAKGEGLQSFEGTVRLPFPAIGFMDGVSVDDLVYASVGYDQGANIQNVNAPIKNDRNYFYFVFSAGLSAKVGNTSVGVGPGVSTTMTLDPSDPAFFLRASLGGLMGPIDEASLGFSIGGHLPFTPDNTWGIDASKASFDGHMWLGGKVNLNSVKLPLAISGNTVIDLDPNDDGKSFFQDPSDGLTYGSNSELDLSVDAKLVSFELPIANATIVGHADQNGAWGMYSGKITQGNGWMPSQVVPVQQTAEWKVAGYVDSDIQKSYLKAQGDLSLDASTLGSWTGLNLSDLGMAQATFQADQKGILITGKASTSFSPVIGLAGNIDAEAFFNGNPNDWYAQMDGRLVIKGIDLGATAHARLDHTGLYVNGAMTTPISLIDMSGQITSSGVDLSGTAQVEIPIVAGKEVIQWVTDAAVCGTETVKDAAVCGYETVTNGAVCGYNYVTSGAQCGYKTVTDGAVCGYNYVTSGAQCGYKTVTSAAICGYKTLYGIAECGAQCVGSGFTNCSCKVAATCQTAKSCNVPKSCSVEASCNTPKTCTTAATCQKVKTCESKTTIPDFDYGTFKGTVTVKIGNSGLYGSATGQYCPTSGSCTTLANGSVKATSGGPEACVTVAGLGEFCAKI